VPQDYAASYPDDGPDDWQEESCAEVAVKGVVLELAPVIMLRRKETEATTLPSNCESFASRERIALTELIRPELHFRLSTVDHTTHMPGLTSLRVSDVKHLLSGSATPLEPHVRRGSMVDETFSYVGNGAYTGAIYEPREEHEWDTRTFDQETLIPPTRKRPYPATYGSGHPRDYTPERRRETLQYVAACDSRIPRTPEESPPYRILTNREITFELKSGSTVFARSVVKQCSGYRFAAEYANLTDAPFDDDEYRLAFLRAKYATCIGKVHGPVRVVPVGDLPERTKAGTGHLSKYEVYIGIGFTYMFPEWEAASTYTHEAVHDRECWGSDPDDSTPWRITERNTYRTEYLKRYMTGIDYGQDITAMEKGEGLRNVVYFMRRVIVLEEIARALDEHIPDVLPD